MNTLGALLDQQAQRGPARLALAYVERKVRYSYERLREGCDRIARGLMRAGLRPGDRVAFQAGNTPESVVLRYALAKMGSVIVPLDPGADPQSAEGVIAYSAARGLVIDDALRLGDLIPNLGACPAGQLATPRFPSLRAVVSLSEERRPGAYRFTDLVDLAELVPAAELRRAQRALRAEDTALLVYDAGQGMTSAELSHRKLLEEARVLARRLELSGSDRILLAAPLSELFGLVAGLLLALVSRAALIPLIHLEGETLEERAREAEASIVVILEEAGSLEAARLDPARASRKLRAALVETTRRSPTPRGRASELSTVGFLAGRERIEPASTLFLIRFSRPPEDAGGPAEEES